MSDSPARKTRLAWRIGLGVAVTGVLSAGAIGIAAATSNPTESSSEPVPAEEHHGPPWRPGGWPGGGPLGLFDMFGDAEISDLSHAEVVLVTENGGTQTVLVQKGAVTEVSASTIAVRSADGYRMSYAVTEQTKVNGDEKIDTVATGEQVVVIAPEAGERPAAGAVLDLSDFGWK